LSFVPINAGTIASVFSREEFAIVFLILFQNLALEMHGSGMFLTSLERYAGAGAMFPPENQTRVPPSAPIYFFFMFSSLVWKRDCTESFYKAINYGLGF
jgi:hypothetical protein